MDTRTSALASGVVDRPPGVARLALSSTVNRTIDAGLRHTILANADIHCGIATYIRNRDGLCVRQACKNMLCENAYKYSPFCRV